ncbi:hypothetical protein V1283_003568 [Bradyrhizobium sp. AZCC 2262]
MRDYTLKEKAKITAGAVAALVIVAWLAVIALALLSGGKNRATWRCPWNFVLLQRSHIRNFVLLRRTTGRYVKLHG